MMRALWDSSDLWGQIAARVRTPISVMSIEGGCRREMEAARVFSGRVVKAPQSIHETLQSAGMRETFGR
jgi:hypothetical protein